MMQEDEDDLLLLLQGNTIVQPRQQPVDLLHDGPVADLLGPVHPQGGVAAEGAGQSDAAAAGETAANLEEVDLAREIDALIAQEDLGQGTDTVDMSESQSAEDGGGADAEDDHHHESETHAAEEEADSAEARLECQVATLKSELAQRMEEHRTAMEEAEEKHRRLREETTAKIDELKKQFALANRDKESMVMKYALGEKEVIIQRKAKEEAEKKWKTVIKERDDLLAKVKTLTADKNRAQQLADSRLQDTQVVKKEVDRWKEEVKVQEAKSCSASARLKAEVESHRETREQLDKTIKHLSETRQEIDVTRKECAEFMQRFREDDEQKKKKTKNTEIEQSAKLIIDAAAASEIENVREKYKKVVDENNAAAQKVHKMERERLENAELIGKLKSTVAAQKQEVSDLLSQVAEMESLRLQLQRSEERCESRVTEVERLRSEAAELEADMTSCRAKEAELLEFTQKLTDKNVTLQSDLSAAESRAAAAEAEHARLAAAAGEIKTKCSQTRIELEEERKRRREETEVLAKKLAEKVRQAEMLGQQALDAENEVRVLKRKNAASLRELTRELQTCKRRLEERESASPVDNNNSCSSRTSSSTSLNRVGDELQHGSNGNSHKGMENGLTSTASYRVGERTHQVLVPDSQVMVEKIVGLQRSMAKKQEKLEFMEEHIGTLLEEVKKKNKIIQHYIMTMETGTMASSESDRIKPALTRKVHKEKERKMSESGE